tara:strand:- start:172 stop:462 length:291 start_codon:yes stop_codon:yes gene_type:complete
MAIDRFLNPANFIRPLESTLRVTIINIEYPLMTEIKLRKGEPVERALRRLKKKVDREGTIKDIRSRRAFEKPSERKRRKMKASKFQAMLDARYANY